MAGMKILREAMDGKTAYSVSRKCTCVGHQQIENLLSGATEPWRVTVETAQQIVEAVEERIQIEDFYRPNVG